MTVAATIEPKARAHVLQRSVPCLVAGADGQASAGDDLIFFITAELWHACRADDDTQATLLKTKLRRDEGPQLAVVKVFADAKARRAVAERYRNPLHRWWAMQVSRLTLAGNLQARGTGRDQLHGALEAAA